MPPPKLYSLLWIWMGLIFTCGSVCDLQLSKIEHLGSLEYSNIFGYKNCKKTWCNICVLLSLTSSSWHHIWIFASDKLLTIIKRASWEFVSVAYAAHIENTYDSSWTTHTSGSTNVWGQPHIGPPNVQWQSTTPKHSKKWWGELCISSIHLRSHHIPLLSVMAWVTDRHGMEMPVLWWHDVYRKPLRQYLSNICTFWMQNMPVYRSPGLIIVMPRKVNVG